jgi:O-antigen/teichoic acid export membrane protein
MADSKSSRGGTLVHLFGSLAEGAFNMLFTIVLVRLISQNDFGSWRQFMSLAAIFWNVAIFGLPASLFYFFSIAKPEERGTIARRTLWLALALGAAASIVFFFALGIAADVYRSPNLSAEALLFTAFFALSFPPFLITPVLVAADQRTVLAMTRFFMGLLRFASLALMLWMDADLRTLLIALNGFALVQFLLMVFLYLRAAGPALVPWKQGFRQQINYSGHVSTQAITGQISVEMDKILVSAYYTPEVFASYSVGARELPFVPLIPYSITDSQIPQLSRFASEKNFADYFDLLHRWVKRIALIMYPIFALILFQFREIFTILFTADYIDGAVPMLIIACLIPMRVTSYYQLLLTLGGSRDVMFVSLGMLVSVTSVSFTLLHFFGPVGATLGLLFSEYLLNGIVVGRIAAKSGSGFSRVLPWSYLLKLLTVAVACGALALPVLGILPFENIFGRVVIFAMTTMTLYVAAVITLGLVSKEDVAQIRAKLRLR